MKATLKCIVYVEIESDLPIEEVVDEFATETDYEFSETPNVRVINTQFEECEINQTKTS